jgi:hypothetical protein
MARRPTITEILAGVGDDPDRARAELDLELASTRPRRTLLDHLVVLVHQPEPEPEPEPPEPLSLTAAVATGDRRQALEALRAHLAERLENPTARCVDCGGFVPLSIPLAAVAKELRAVVDELSKLAPPEESRIDEISQRREARLRGSGAGGRAAAVPARPAGGDPRVS